MRGALHVLATVVLVPYVALATAFLVLGHAIAQGDLWSLVDTLLEHALWIMPWGLIGFGAALVAIAVLGAVPRTRVGGAAILCALAAASLVVLVALESGPLDAGGIVFLLPAVAVLAYATWLAIAETRARDAGA